MNQWFRYLVLVTPFLFLSPCLIAQDGGDQVGPFNFRYDRLNRANGFFAQFFSSKALGVYTNNEQPSSLLEVNSTGSHYDWLHPNVNDRGELLRTTAPGNVTANWRFFHGAGNQVGRFWSVGADDHLHLGATSGRMHLLSEEDDWRFDRGNGTTVGRMYTPGTGTPHFEILSRQEDLILRSNNGTDNGRERMRVFDQNFGASPGMVRIADPQWGTGSAWFNSTNGPGGFPNEEPRLLVVGGTDAATTNMTEIAQFRTPYHAVSDASITVRGARTGATTTPIAHIDLANWENDLGVEYDMARITAAKAVQNGSEGCFAISTNDGTGLVRNVLVDEIGRTGIGAGIFGQNNPPQARLDIAEPDPGTRATLRLTQDYNNVFTDMRTTTNGELLVDPTGDNVGINVGNPTRQLDVQGNARFRDLPGSTTSDPVENVVVDADGNLHVGPPPGGSGGDNDWFVNNTTNVPGAITDDIYTENRVGIGDEFAPAGPSTYRGKLHVIYDESYSTPPTSAGVFQTDYAAVNLTPPAQVNGAIGRVSNVPANGLGVGVLGVSSGPDGQKIGVFGEGTGDGINKGVFGRADELTATENYGGEFIADAGPFTAISYGVRAQAPSAPGNTNFAAGYFEGDVYVTGQHLLSDQMFKKNIDSLDSAMAKIMQLEPRSFNLDTTNYGYMGLTSGKKYGMIAQDVEQVMPELVNTIRQPAVRDSAGNVIHQAFDYKTLSYDRFIPFLVQGVQEQQAQIDSLNECVDSLEQRNDSLLTLIQQNQARDQQQSDSLAALHVQVDSLGTDSLLARIEALEDCMEELPQGLGCDGGPNALKDNGSSDIASVTVETKVHVNYDSSMTEVKGDRPVKEGTELHQNRPNPFRYVTTFSYDLAREGRVELIVHDQQGRYVTHVVDAEQSSGPHEVRWNATDVESGIYYYTLRVDGMEWVKKAIKLK